MKCNNQQAHRSGFPWHLNCLVTFITEYAITLHKDQLLFNQKQLITVHYFIALYTISLIIDLWAIMQQLKQ